MKLKKGSRKRKLDEVLIGSGYEVCFEKDWFENSPKCEHGPMLLFERYASGKKVKSFYACSANRNRKGCRAYVEKELKDKKKPFQQTILSQNEKSLLHDEVSTLPVPKRIFCITCQKFISVESRKNHLAHKLQSHISDKQMLGPSSLFITADTDATAASQYFINSDSISFLFATLTNLHVSHVVCMGMPRLHEHIHCKKLVGGEGKNMQSYLLDIDARYHMFWPQTKFSRFNMFNRYFFDKEGEAELRSFLKSCFDQKKKCALVLDPPFGGMVDCIAETLTWFQSLCTELSSKSGNKVMLDIFWMFPYFMSKRIVERMPKISMLDYQVGYDNQKENQISPVRIFTNVPSRKLPLPSDEYRFCPLCQRYVFRANKHCRMCKACPSLSGKTYRHCNLCRKCVQPGRDHCFTCNKCVLPSHTCRPDVGPAVCHLCGKEGHKRKDCPTRNES